MFSLVLIFLEYITLLQCIKYHVMSHLIIHVLLSLIFIIGILYNCRLAEPLPPQVSNVKITSLEVLKFEKKELDGKVCLFVYHHGKVHLLKNLTPVFA